MSNQIENFLKRIEFFRYGIIAMTLTAGSCWGSVAAYFILMNQSSMVQLSICAVLTMGSNALAIAMAPMRAILFTFGLSIIGNALLILFNL